LGTTVTGAVPELVVTRASPPYEPRTDVVPTGNDVVVRVAVHAVSRQGPTGAEPSAAVAVPLVAVNATEPVGVTPRPGRPSTLTVAFKVTGAPTLDDAGVAVTVVALGSRPAAVAGAAVIIGTTSAAARVAVALADRRMSGGPAFDRRAVRPICPPDGVNPESPGSSLLH
jgi:hypothetical protein